MSTHNSGWLNASSNSTTTATNTNNSYASYFLGSAQEDLNQQLGAGGSNDSDYASDDISIDNNGVTSLSQNGLYSLSLDTWFADSGGFDVLNSTSAFLAVDFDLTNLASNYSSEVQLQNITRPMGNWSGNSAQYFLPRIQRQITVLKSGEDDGLITLQKRQFGFVNPIGVNAYLTIKKIADVG